ncbi:MAG: sigma-70 family RNA polymerase sigma factor [Planctomycetota bacterium]
MVQLPGDDRMDADDEATRALDPAREPTGPQTPHNPGKDKPMQATLSASTPVAEQPPMQIAGTQRKPRREYVATSPEEVDALFEKAVAEHGRRLLAIARSIVGFRASPEDVVQQAMLNLYKHRLRYDWEAPGPLMKRAVINESLRLLRPPKMSMVQDDHPAPDKPKDAPDAAMMEDETVAQVRAAIDKLPEHFRAALVLCEYEQMSYAEIAKTLDASVPQIKTWLHRARRRLAGMLEPYVKAGRGDLS